MSKPVKDMILADYKRRFQDVEDALLIDIRGINANDNNTMRLGLAAKDIRVTVIKNSLACKAFAGTRLEALSSVLQGPSAVVWGAESVVDVARELVQWSRKVGELDLKAAVLDGELFDGDAAVARLGQYPTKTEALARVAKLLLAPAGTVVSAALGPASQIAGIVKEISDRLEKGEAIAGT